jgi:hypothetical protein
MSFAVMLAPILSGCSNKPPVRTESDPSANFSRYRTYAWSADAPPEPAPGDPDPPLSMLAWRARTAVDAQLAYRGYVQTDVGEADLLVGVRSAIDERHANTIRNYLRYGDAGGTQGLVDAYTFGYELAILTVELYDAGSRQLVWRGDGIVAMDAKDRNARAAATVAQMFTEFPGH